MNRGNHSDTGPRRWRRPRLIRSRWLRGALSLLTIGYLVWATSDLPISWERVARGGERAARLLNGFLSPHFGDDAAEVWDGLLESLAIAVAASAIGVVSAVPLAFGAARNVAPRPIYLACRALLAALRSVHEVILAIFFVVAVGFGPLAGVLTLIVGSIGFLAKLLAEAVESIDPRPREAIRATGASPLLTLLYGVAPQVLPRFWGLALYRLDINFRESAVIGVVGAGGIGATLNTAFDRYDYGLGAAIVLVIAALVLAAEYGSARIRMRWLV